MRKHTGKAGLGTSGLLVTVAAVVVLAAAGWLVYGHHHKTASDQPVLSGATPTGQSPHAYAGWKAYTLPNEKLSFKYPSNWTLKVGPTPLGVSKVTPGMDNVSVTSPTGLMIIMQTGLWGVGGGGQVTLADEQISALGGTYYLDYQGCDIASPTQTTCTNQNVTFAYLATKANGSYMYPAAKNITFRDASSSGSPAVGIFVGYDLDAVYPGAGGVTQKPLSAYKGDASYADARLLLQSLSY